MKPKSAPLVKVKPLLCIFILTSLSHTLVGHALSSPTIASLAIQNLSEEPLIIHCTVSLNTQFLQYPHENGHIFKIAGADPGLNDVLSIDIQQITPRQTLAPNLICSEIQHTQNYFQYQLILPYSESVEVGGKFEYDSSYPGSIIYKPDRAFAMALTKLGP